MLVKNGNTVSVHYKGTLSDGTVFDDSRPRGKPMEFEVGSRKLIKGFSQSVVGMTVGETKTINIPVDDAYGPHNPEAVQTIPRTAFSENHTFEVGGTVQGSGPRGPFLARIQEIEDENIILDMNHPLAGEALTFEIEVLSVSETKTTTE